MKTALRMLALSGVVLSCVTACDSDVSLGKNDDSIASGDDDGSCADADSATWTSFADVEWSLEPGSEAFYCSRTTIAEAGYVHALRNRNDPGTYDAVVSVGAPSGPDGIEICAATAPENQVLRSGAGMHEAILSQGQALPILAGQQLVLRVHVINTLPLLSSGRSSLLLQLLPEADVTESVASFDPGVRSEPGLPASLPPPSECDPWTALIAQTWELQPGSEAYFCQRKTLTADATFREVRILAPAHTASLVVSVGDAAEPDGFSVCNDQTSENGVVLGAVAGRHRLELAQGYSRTIPAGQQLLLRHHARNTTFEVVGGTVTAEIR